MRLFLAKFFKFFFSFSFLKKYFFGFYKRFFKPLNLFHGITQKVKFNNKYLIVHIDDWIQQNIYFLGEYEKAELKILDKYLTNNSVFIDIGANFGLYSIYASRFIGINGQIISFEPFENNFNSLITNIKINNLSNIKAEKIAIGETNGTTELYYDEQEKNLGMVSVKFLKNSIHEKVKKVSLDSYFKNNPVNKIDLIKIDIEGYEYNALLGMRDLLKKFHPILIIEILENCKNEENIITYLERLDYKRNYIDDNGDLSDYKTNTNRMNYVFKQKVLN